MNKAALLYDEELIIRDGGEMPEVNFHGSIFYLSEDHKGPRITLDPEDHHHLKVAVLQGYRRIILRDLMPENRDKGLYRGLERCRVNWRRLVRFCKTERLNIEEIRSETVFALKNFMILECAEVGAGLRHSSINCTTQGLASFLEDLGLEADELPDGWQDMCLAIPE